ncbi:ATP-grasp domain-containing protein [Candidatus Nomurabacteria bacterium]|nr:ATP-grasp domain-containing protein [Candidatus Nomurabacteria bacterium]
MKKNTQKKVLCVDYENWDSLMEIPYLFHKADCAVDIYAQKNSWLRKSKYHKNYFPANKNKNIFIQNLEKISKKNIYEWIILCDEESLNIINNSTNKYLIKKALPLSNNENRNILNSKKGISLACTKYKIPTPEYEIYDKNQKIEKLTKEIQFPILLKIDKSAGGSGIFLCKNIAEISENINKIPKQKIENLVLQQYIKGQNIAVETLYKNGNLIAYAYSIVTKTISNEFGLSSERIYIQYPEIKERLKFIGKSFGINGFCSMTFMADSKEHYLIEADLRPQAWYALARLAGTDFSQAIKEFISKNPQFIKTKFPKNKKEIAIRHMRRDLIWNIINKNYKGILYWFLNIENRWKVIPWHDLKLVFYITAETFKTIKRKVFNRKINSF